MRLGGMFSPARREHARRDFEEEIESHLAMHGGGEQQPGIAIEQNKAHFMYRSDLIGESEPSALGGENSAKFGRTALFHRNDHAEFGYFSIPQPGTIGEEQR